MKPGIVVHTCNPNTEEAESRLCEFEVSLDYLVNARPAELKECPISKKEEKTKPLMIHTSAWNLL